MVPEIPSFSGFHHYLALSSTKNIHDRTQEYKKTQVTAKNIFNERELFLPVHREKIITCSLVESRWSTLEIWSGSTLRRRGNRCEHGTFREKPLDVRPALRYKGAHTESNMFLV